MQGAAEGRVGERESALQPCEPSRSLHRHRVDVEVERDEEVWSEAAIDVRGELVDPGECSHTHIDQRAIECFSAMPNLPAGLAVDQAGEVGDGHAVEVAAVHTYQSSRVAAEHEARRADGHARG